MLVPGLPLLLILTSFSPTRAAHDSCADCEQNGPWWPLFRPSQILQSDFPEHRRARQADPADAHAQGARAELRVDGVARPAVFASAPGLDRAVDRGRHRLQWDHYGVKQEAANEAQLRERAEQRGSESHEGSFFNDGSFFGDSPKPRGAFSKDFGVSRESTEAVSNSLDSREAILRRRPPTSYSAFRSIVAGVRGVPPLRRDLLHPDIPGNDVFSYIHNSNAASRSQHLNGRNVSLQYLVHEAGPGEVPFVTRDHPVYRYVRGHAPSGQARRVAHDLRVEHVLPSRTPVKESLWQSKSDGTGLHDHRKNDSFQKTSRQSKLGEFPGRRAEFSASPVDPVWKAPDTTAKTRLSESFWKSESGAPDTPMKTPKFESFWKTESEGLQNRRNGFSASPVDPFWKGPVKDVDNFYATTGKNSFPESSWRNDHGDFQVRKDTYSDIPSTAYTNDEKNDGFKIEFDLPSKDSFQEIFRKESKQELSYLPTESPFFQNFWKNKEFSFNQASSTRIPAKLLLKDQMGQKIDLLTPSGQTLFLFKKKANDLDLKKSAARKQSNGQSYAYLIKKAKRM